MVPFGFRIACRRASWPTSRSPCSVNATTDGVVRDPSALGITVGWPPSTVAMTEFVVPRSTPTDLAMFGPPRSRANGPLVEARCLADGFQFEELDQLAHAALAFAFADALTDLGEARRGVDVAIDERADRRFDHTPVRVVEAVQQLRD